MANGARAGRLAAPLRHTRWPDASRPTDEVTTVEPEAATAGANQSFDAFYAVAFAPLVVQLAAYTGDRTEAQDVVQEAFVCAWPRWDRIVHYDDPTAWVRRVAWNLATSRWRRARTALAVNRRQRLELIGTPEPDRVDLLRALGTLPPAQRRALVLHHIAGLTVAEIAAEADVPEGTVKSWLYRARGALARQLAES